MSFRLLHTADLHLEAPFVGAGRTPRPVARRLASAGLDTLDRLVERALEQQVDALVVAGGLLPPAPGPATLARVRAALEALAGAGVATVVVGHPGEPLHALAADAPQPGGVTFVGPGPVRTIPVRRGSDGEVVVEILAASGVAGLAALAANGPAELAALAELAAPAEHRPATVADGQPPAGDRPARVAVCALPPPTPDDPRPPPLDHSPVAYWALGGRWPASLARLADDGGWVAMAGTPQLHGFADPGVVSGAVLVEGDPDGPRLRDTPRWLPVAAVQPVTVPVPLAEVSDVDELVQGLRRIGRDLAAARPARLVVARAGIEGVGAVRLALVDPVVRAWVLEQLRGDSPDVWWADLILAPLPAPAAEPLLRTDRLAEAAVQVGGAARAEGPGDVLSRAWAEVGPRPEIGTPAGPAWTGLLREATSVVFDHVGGERSCG